MHEIKQQCNDLSQYCQGTMSPPLSQSVYCAVNKSFESSSTYCLRNPPGTCLNFGFPFFLSMNVSYMTSRERETKIILQLWKKK